MIDLSKLDGYEEAIELYNNNNLQKMIEMQNHLGVVLSEKYDHYKNPNELADMTLNHIYSWLRDQIDFLNDEFKELVDALPGSSLDKNDRSALVKNWKYKYKEINNRKLSDLSEQEKLDILMEFIDMFHFFMNITMPFKLTEKDIFILYYIKNRENIKRWNNNY